MDDAELGLEFSFRQGLEFQKILFYFSSQTVYGICYGNYWTTNQNERNVVNEIGGQHTCHLTRMLMC